MSRAITFVFLLAAIGFYALAMTTPAQCALLLSMACEGVFWKRSMDALRARRAVRIARSPAIRGRR